VTKIEGLGPEEVMEAMRESTGALLAAGIVQALLGSAAIVAPQVATRVGTEFLGVLLIFAAPLQFWQGLRLRSWKGTSLLTLAAALDLALGVMLLLVPARGAVALTLLLAILLVVQGVTRIGLHQRAAPQSGALGFRLAGILGIVLGGLLWWEWPSDSVWAIGLLLGVNLLVGGLAMVSLSLALRGSGGDGPTPA